MGKAHLRIPSQLDNQTSGVQDIFLAQRRLMDADVAGTVQDAVRLVRTHLGMDVGFISEFLNGQRIFRYVDTDESQPAIKPGDADPLDESYCNCIVEGSLPEIMTDTADFPVAMALQVTRELEIGAYIGVPIKLSDGRLYGSFCCYSHETDSSLRERDLATVRMFAEFVAKQIESRIIAGQTRIETVERLIAVIEKQDFNIVYQPIYDLQQNRIIGFESLSRFPGQPLRTPDIWFNEAAETGLSEQLEMITIKQAVKGIEHLPDDIYITLNVSPAHVISGAVIKLLDKLPLQRIVLEVTEHAPVSNYQHFETSLQSLREKGLRLAIDDVGAGYASFRHILKLKPDIIKLDMSITRDIHIDPARRALATALIAFAGETGCSIVAEGVENNEELVQLRNLQIRNAQGFYVGRPMPLNEAKSYLDHKLV